MPLLDEMKEAVVRGDRDQVVAKVGQALSEGLPPGDILTEGLIRGMDVVGGKFQKGEYYIPHMLLAARAMHGALDLLKPRLAASGAKPAGKVVLGTVKGDHHDIGKNLVAMMLEGKGFEVVDLGIDVPPRKFVEAIADDVQIVALSALLSTTAPFLKETIAEMAAAGVRDRVKVMVGGGVVTQEYADAIGADAYGRDAASAAEIAVRLVGQG